MAATVASKRLELDGGSIGYLAAGSGPPLLYLHGGGGAGTWDQAYAIWARDHHLVVPEHPGFGSSDELPEIEGVDDLVYHYLDVMDALRIERAALVGASFGGWIAAELAVQAPQRVAALALLSPVGLRIAAHPITDLFFMPPRDIPAALFADISRMPAPPGPPDVDTLLALYRDQTALARYTWAPFMCNPKLERRLWRVKAPTLVLWPEQDSVVPREHAERYAQLIPQARLQTIADCGHALQRERPEEVAAAVADFLREVERR